jgi:predicted Co/Zn/Cd cation transporter (cation efflux family)
MTEHHTDHAAKVVQTFRYLLSDKARAAVGEAHFTELGLLIESAVDTAVLQEIERVADEIAALARAVRTRAESYED